MNKNTNTVARYSITVRTGRKVEERATRCTNQETAHRVARDIARDAEKACVVELVSPAGTVVERFTVAKDLSNRLEVLNGTSVQAVRRAEREAAKGTKVSAAA